MPYCAAPCGSIPDLMCGGGMPPEPGMGAMELGMGPAELQGWLEMLAAPLVMATWDCCSCWCCWRDVGTAGAEAAEKEAVVTDWGCCCAG